MTFMPWDEARCEVCDAEAYSFDAGGTDLGECGNCYLFVCSLCHVGGDDVVDACLGCR